MTLSWPLLNRSGTVGGSSLLKRVTKSSQWLALFNTTGMALHNAHSHSSTLAMKGWSSLYLTPFSNNRLPLAISSLTFKQTSANSEKKNRNQAIYNAPITFKTQKIITSRILRNCAHYIAASVFVRISRHKEPTSLPWR